MRPCAIALLATLLLPFGAHATEAAPALLLKELASLAGANSRDCGAIALSGNRDAAIGCARSAAASGNAYRIALQMKGSDSYTWQGVARDERGRQWAVFYDADTSAGTEASPGLGRMLCRDITFAPDKDEIIDCTPVTGGQ
jgi:hypothetical protein